MRQQSPLQDPGPTRSGSKTTKKKWEGSPASKAEKSKAEIGGPRAGKKTNSVDPQYSGWKREEVGRKKKEG